MIFTTIYRASFYVMLLLATLTMSIDAIDSRFRLAYPAATAVVALFALLTLDRNPRLALPRWGAYQLLVVFFALAIAEYLYEENLILSLAHLLVYLQLVKMLLPKKTEDDWLLFGLSVMQVLVGAVISQSDRVGALLVAWVLTALWVLGLFSLYREAVRARLLGGPVAEPSAAEPYPDLFRWELAFSTLRVMGTTLILGGVIFMLIPRRAATARVQGVANPSQHMTGFDEEVQLGQMGEILESDRVVMSVELSDAKGRRIALGSEEPLWRGVTMEEYRDGRWHRLHRHSTTIPKAFTGANTVRRTVRQQVRLEPTDSDVLFGLRPMLDAHGGRVPPDLNALDGTLFRPYAPRPIPYEYEVVSALDPGLAQPGESRVVSRELYRRIPFAERLSGRLNVSGELTHMGEMHVGRLRDLVAVPENLRPRLQKIALAVLAREHVEPQNTRAAARALEHWLRDSGEFTYSLRMDVVDPDLDPVEDFLVHRKEGHCEYFASALTLLLRSIGAPARMINGFKGADYNELARVYYVRQKHAHSWVEAFDPEHPEGTFTWLTFDPTPATERDESVAQVGGFGKNLRQITDLVRYLWVFYVVGFNSERQTTLIYEPLQQLVRNARDGFQMMGAAIRGAVGELIYFRSARQLVSLRGFLVSFLGLLVLVGLGRGLYWLGRRVLRWYRGDGETAALAASLLFYRRLEQLLATIGLERPPTETQHEFARRASLLLAGRDSETAPLADVPGQVADAFYRIRFGHRELAPDDLSLLESRLDALEHCLSGSRR